MYQFVWKLGLLLALVSGVSYSFFYRPLMELDPAYAKSTHRANSLILGGSRAGQGLSPDTIQKILDQEGVMLNFAFNGYYSPYGPAYLGAIKRKLIEGSKDGLFILSVNAGVLSDPANLAGLREEEYTFYDLYFMNMNPNLEYMLRDMGAQRAGQTPPLLRLQGLKRRAHKRIYHANGWMEVLVGNSIDPDEIPEKRRKDPQPSPIRLAYLKKTIAHLQQYGQVVLVRVPAGEYFWAYENDVYPHFEADIQRIVEEFEIPFFNFFKVDYPFHDTKQHHLISAGAQAFSADLAQAIKIWQKEGRIEIPQREVEKPVSTQKTTDFDF